MKPAPYVIKMVHRMILLGLSALMGAVVGTAIIAVPIQLLHELGVVAYRIDQHDTALWTLGILGALWGIAHLLDTIIKGERGGSA
jgi:hypothetical protein